MDDLYHGQSGLYSLWVDLGRIITELEKRRKNGNGTTKEIIARLHELNENLYSLQREWSRSQQATAPRVGLDEILKRLG
jgi:hypothetical protein